MSSFGFVEMLGGLFGAKLAARAFGGGASHAKPVEPEPGADLSSIPEAERAPIAENMIRGMSLTRFAPIVLLTGHGATSTNNPYASALECGACGGHPGDTNARVACALLNDPGVRADLRAREIHIPDDTTFVPALHNTTTDELTLLAPLPVLHEGEAPWLNTLLGRASEHARRRRARKFDLSADAAGSQALMAKARDWSDVRPEWGLAGCEAFVAAPRARTARLDLDGRAFLHTYDSALDPDRKVLASVMTAPMVVAMWINLQYFASSVAPEIFGSGNKTLHNVVGGLGVLEGSSGDLRAGLPSQSVSDGTSLRHTPVRLAAYIEAPRRAIQAVLEDHPEVHGLVRNGWITLFQIDRKSGELFRHTRDGRWVRARCQKASEAA